MLKQPRGFTIIELMVTIALFSILLALAMPRSTRAAQGAGWRQGRNQSERWGAKGLLFIVQIRQSNVGTASQNSPGSGAQR